MSATRPFFISQKEINLVDHMNEELIDEIVGQSVDIYKISPEHTPSNIYGESTTKYYDIADAFILCNRTWNNKIEGLPNVVLEAMGRSKPVIGSKNSGTEELIIDGKTGYIVDPENIQDIKEIIISASENRNQLKVMGDNALNFIQKNFSNKKLDNNWHRTSSSTRLIAFFVFS